MTIAPPPPVAWQLPATALLLPAIIKFQKKYVDRVAHCQVVGLAAPLGHELALQAGQLKAPALHIQQPGSFLLPPGCLLHV